MDKKEYARLRFIRDPNVRRFTQALNLIKNGQDPFADLRLRAETLLHYGNRAEIPLTQAERDTLERICLIPTEDDRAWLGETFDPRLEALEDDD